MEKGLGFVDLFSGIGGIRQGFERHGHKAVAFSEIDKYAIKAYKALYGEEDRELGDVSVIPDEKLNEMYDEVDLVVGGSPCFIEGTPVLTESGYKAINEIKKGEKVLTHTGSFEKVLMPMKRSAKGIYTIKTQGLPEVKATEEHPFLAVKKTRKFNSERRNYDVFFSGEEWIAAKDLTKDHYVKIPAPKSDENPLKITKQEAWLIGRYIADGHYDNRKRKGRKNSYLHNVIYSVGYTKIDEFKSKIDEYHVGWIDHRTVKRARIGSVRLLDLVMRCGKGAYNKQIPPEYLSLPDDLLRELLDGYLSGDGSYHPDNNSYRATTVSPGIAKSLSLAMVKTYKQLPSFTFTKRPPTCVIEGRVVNQKDTYTIQRFISPKKSCTYTNKNGEMYTPIRKISFDSNWEGDVYNIEVENDNSYTVNNLAVHNCQAFSVAGGRGGFDDTRGSLFFEYCRILKQTQPKYFLFENVKGVLSHDKGQTIDTMIRAFNEVGYTVDLNLLNSKYFGVPQNRERIFVVGVRSDLIENEEWITLGGGVLAQGRKRLKEAGDIKTFNFDWPQQTSVDTRLRDVLEVEVDEKYYISEEKTAKLIKELKEKDQNKILAVKGDILTRNDPKAQYGFDSDVMFTLRCAVTHGVAEKVALQDQPSPVMVDMIGTKGNESIRRVYGVNGVCNTLTTMQGGNREPKIAEPQQVLATLTPERVERRQQGRRFKDNDEPAFTLTALDRHGVTTVKYSRKTGIGEETELALCLSASDWRGLNRNQNQNAVLEYEPIYRIRKLTPLECWRLQSFSDEDFYKVKESGISDSQLYKQAGNCVTINVIDAIAKNMTALHKQLEEESLSLI